MNHETAAHCRTPERACNVCERAYRPRRSTSQFCSATCRKRASRGSFVPEAPSKEPSALRSWLTSRGYAEPLDAGMVGLTIPLATAAIELNYACRKIADSGLRCAVPRFTEENLAAALVAVGFDHRFPEALGRPVKRNADSELA